MTDSHNPASHLRQEYEQQKALFENQPTIIQRFLESQAQAVADALTSGTSQAHFMLPDKVVTRVEQVRQDGTITLPEKKREYRVGGLWTALTHHVVRDELLHRLRAMEQSPDQGISTGVSLLRYSAAIHMVYKQLPSGRTVTYRADEDETIPSIPLDDQTPESAITQASDAIAEDGAADAGRGALQTPFVPAARRFYLPQWVAFDDQGHLLAGTEKEAEAHLRSMQKYVRVLHNASSLAPYIVASEEYHHKRYGILGQLVNQGRALANFKNTEIIREIKNRAEKGALNRGLTVSIPYFDDQSLEMNDIQLDIIPAGRIMFVPAFVVRAAREEAAKRTQDTRFNASTRRHLLAQLKALETAFSH